MHKGLSFTPEAHLRRWVLRHRFRALQHAAVGKHHRPALPPRSGSERGVSCELQIKYIPDILHNVNTPPNGECTHVLHNRYRPQQH